jgi:hypothetical protein
VVAVILFSSLKLLTKSNKHSSDAPGNSVPKEGALGQEQVIRMGESGLEDAHLILCYEVIVAKQLKTQSSIEVI